MFRSCFELEINGDLHFDFGFDFDVYFDGNFIFDLDLYFDVQFDFDGGLLPSMLSRHLPKVVVCFVFKIISDIHTVCSIDKAKY